LRAEFRGSAPDAGKIPGVFGMQNVFNGVSIVVGVMKMALYSFYTRRTSGQYRSDAFNLPVPP
jgi:hypothetical protein